MAVSGDDLCCMTPQELGAYNLKRTGYVGGGGKDATARLAGGGGVPGERAGGRPDRKGKGAPVTVNVIVAGKDGGASAPHPMPIMAGRPMIPPGPPPGAGPPPGIAGPPPGAGLPPGMAGPPPGMPGRPVMLPPQMRAKGGTVKVRQHVRRRAGGAV